MVLKRIDIKNFTVFESISMEYNSGINVFLGENGVGKTHVLKILYSACQAAKHDVSFPYKLVRVFRPDGSNIQRLVSRKNTGGTASIKVFSDEAMIGVNFSTKTKKWYADEISNEKWERQNSNLESTFIPAKEILSNSYNLTEAASKGNVDFDDTYIDIIASAKIDISRGKDSAERKKYLDILQKINNGKVTVEQDKFYLKPGTQAKIEFNLVAEGIRKIALLWQLIKNGTLEKGSILFWDEPEANINPIHVPVIVELLLMLQRDGVQVFICTHDYFLAKYFDVRKKDDDQLSFYSFYKEKDEEKIKVENAEDFSELENNTIMETFIALYHEEIGVMME